METIFIPRLSVFRRDKNVLFDIARFCAVTGFTCTTPPDQQQSRKGNIVGRVFNTLRAAVLSKTSKTRKEYNVLREEEDLACTNDRTCAKDDILLSFKSQKELKKVLLNLISKHKTAMSMVGKARKACWSAEEKLNKLNQTMRKEDLKHGEKAKRSEDLKEMNLQMHKEVFEMVFAREKSLRETIQKLAINLEIEVVTVIAAAIRNLMSVHKQTISEAEVARLAAKLYEDNCRGYIFQVVDNDACQKVPITKPVYVKTVIKI